MLEVQWLRLRDWAGSKWRTYKKVRRLKKRWPGRNPIDMERSGRRYSRVEWVEFTDSPHRFVIRPEPGWEWTCSQCHTYSFVRESDMPAILAEWNDFTERSKKRGFKPAHAAPTAATAGCPECKFRPGAPE
jgi:hypothetical protein